MRIAMLADIHANREALEACLRDVEAKDVDQIVLLGDYVGYGADPEWVVEKVMGLCDRGARAVKGNHDNGVAEPREELSADAAVAMAWTRGQLGQSQRAFLARLPMRVEEDGRLFVHANVHADASWLYVDGAARARKAIDDGGAQVVFCGHVHVPLLYGVTATDKLVSFRPVMGAPVPLPRHRRWLGVLGSVGQPRDGNPAACYSILDTDDNEVVWLRVPYDVDGAAKKIEQAGLPQGLADRLRKGR
jgi:diadenosine tetraphosphatase ApaH/serine/threonine PP2A family protein phosphatase